LDALKENEEEEKKKEAFNPEKGEIDMRREELLDEVLDSGFYRSCGIKGNKLSGG
jgi:hypothetical protein